MPYLIATLIFLLRMFTIFVFDRFLTPLSKKNKIITRVLDTKLSKLSPREEGDKTPFRLRVISYFLSEKDVEKSDSLRMEMYKIVREYKGNPGKTIFLFISKLVINWLFFISTFIFAYNKPSIVFSLIVVIILASFWLLQKRYLFCLISIIVSVYFYRYLPAATAYYLSLVILLSIVRMLILKSSLQKNAQS